jgi:sigma-E factor negative regulatory protein RseB
MNLTMSSPPRASAQCELTPSCAVAQPRTAARTRALVAGTVLSAFSVMSYAQTAHVQSQSKRQSIDWLDRISKSARELPYTGVFVHQTVDGATTQRITHVVDKNGVEHEKLEMLDGPLTEIIRRNEEMFRYSPDQKMIRVDRRATGRFFPSLISGNPKEIVELYRVKVGSVERIAGHDCQWIVLEPRDTMRYLQKLCAELGTGLLLRARLYNDRNQLLEQFMFTQLDVTGAVAKQPVRSRFESSAGWQRDESLKTNTKLVDSGWDVGNLPAGFRKITEMVRSLTGRKDPIAHLVFSDGVSHVSVFVEPAGGAPVQPVARATPDGPITIAIRPVADHQVTVVGEVPVDAVQAIADGVTRRR